MQSRVYVFVITCNGSMFVDKVGRGEEKSPESQSETTGLLKPPDAGGNLPRSPSSEAVQKVRVSAVALSIGPVSYIKISLCSFYFR